MLSVCRLPLVYQSSVRRLSSSVRRLFVVCSSSIRLLSIASVVCLSSVRCLFIYLSRPCISKMGDDIKLKLIPNIHVYGPLKYGEVQDSKSRQLKDMAIETYMVLLIDLKSSILT